ncbi:hypothetical protein KUF71_000853 [Frankliniella fusca]|uniref:RNA-directed DNA polymerase n=1 Tax=Frankliniella fusca TaxID=407009 RepID=A0AAE1HCQ6_9NEOP|nr:hypothetical protein KUF71_000853 [Frankliniella fusca]
MWAEFVDFSFGKVQMKLDTGAEVNVMPKRLLDCALDVESVPLLGLIACEAFGLINRITYKSNEISNICRVSISALETATVCPLELRELGSRNNLCKPPGKEVHFVDNQPKDSQQNLKELIASNPTVFTKEPGCFPKEYSLQVDNSKKPVAVPSRRVPFAIKKPYQLYLNQLCDQQIISKCDNPKGYISPVVIVEKPDNSLRICLDAKYLNEALCRPFFEIPSKEDINMALTNKTYFMIQFVHEGWPKQAYGLDNGVKDFFNLRAELYCENELLYFQIRLVIPNTLRPQLLQQLHSGHQGMVKCKSLASQSIFWPGINKDIESPSVIPNVVDKLTKKSLKAKAYYDSSANAKEIQYSPSDYVFIKNPLTGKWEPGMVINVCAEPRSYLVKTNSSNNVLRRNCTFLKPRSVSAPFRTPVYLLPSRTNVEIPNNHDVQNNNNNQIVIPLQEVNENLNRWREQLRERFAQGARQERPPVQTRSGRVVNKPDRLNL